MSLKILTLIAISFTSAFASANSAFKNDSKVPASLQDKIVAELAKNCPKVAKYSLQEVSTIEHIDRVDQGIVDYYYSTTFTGSSYFDGQHPISVSIDVESAVLSGYHAEGSEIVRLITSHDDVCY